VQTNLVAIRQFLIEQGIPCEAINLTRFRRPDRDGVYYPKNALELMWLLARLPYDILHLHIGGNLSARLLGLSLLCCWLPGRRAVLTFHSGGYPSSAEGRAMNARSWRGFVLRQFDALIAVNQEIVGFFEKCGVARSRIRMIPPHALPASRGGGCLPEWLREFFESHQPLLLTVGLLEPEYDLPLQIEVLSAVRQRYPNAGLAIVGSGSLQAQLEVQIEGVPYASDIKLCGDVEHGVTLSAIEACDVFLRTTLYDGDSISVREALHLGVPVIATDNGMRPPGVHLIAISDRDGCRRMIEQVLADPLLQEPLARHTNADNILAVLRLYRELLKLNK
jgi:glycosyltransferase involved in cell wall biosynthesis